MEIMNSETQETASAEFALSDAGDTGTISFTYEVAGHTVEVVMDWQRIAQLPEWVEDISW